MIVTLEPQDVVASRFMSHKGYDIRPYDVEKLDGQPCWYYYYELPEGILELEVSWDGRDWETLVTSFSVDSD